ncbi:MAG: outer membrane protein assembly factor BamA [Acidobacteria bacterium]|nr:outer membrane protein assembly factor BamA [Acidobacteriota bacterium]
MLFGRPLSLNVVRLCLIVPALLVDSLSFPLLAQAQQQQPPAAAPPKPAQAAKPNANPFETVPGSAQPQAPAAQSPKPAQGAKPASPFEQPTETPQPPGAAAPKPAEPGKPAVAEAPVADVIEAIEFRGARRVPQDTLRALIFSKKGDKLDRETLHRDFMALWNQGRFDDITLEQEAGRTGWIIRFRLVERRVVRSIKYDGMKSITVSEILDRFKERRVGLSVEQQYDPARVQRAAIVLKEYLSERGRQFATVEPEVVQIPPSSLEVKFVVTEGPKVKVGSIDIEGNTAFKDNAIIRAMKNSRPIGIPYSIFLEKLFAKSFDSTKLEQDKEMIRDYYQQRGYFTARAVEHTSTVRDTGGRGFKIPVLKPNKPGKSADLKIVVEEGKLYRMNNMNFTGVKLFRTPETIFPRVFQMEKGDIFSTTKLRKGLEQMRKIYGEFGYIDFVPEPDFAPDTAKGQIDLNLSVDEGKQFFLRRLDFQGNTTTRDKVIRREILLDEGQVYNTRYWELSLLRLNQLGYFEVLKENEAADIKRDTKTNTVDITLKVKERGKNSVQLNGGVSGIAGSFIGFGYSTNNFLGLGETLSLDAQLGDRIRNITLGFTEPYLFDRPITAGFTIFTNRFNYDQGREVSLLTGRNLIPLYNQLGRDNLLNYVSNGYGFTAFLSSPWRRTFARVGLTYTYSTQQIQTESVSARAYFQYINFQGLAGQNQLSGIKTSALTPSYTYNTVDHPITPSRGRSLFATTQFATIGGNVRMIEPTIDFKYFRAGLKKGHVIGMHALGRYVTGYSGRVAPPFNRFYMGGENDIRGFEIWQISPIAYIPSEATVPLLNADGSARTQRIVDPATGILSTVTATTRIPSYQLISPGGDTQGVGNFEYRIPIVGPLTLALFADAGINKISNTSQLVMNEGRLGELNGFFPQAAFDRRVVIDKLTQQMRSSVGVEFQIMMPVVNAPFRLYWAYNPQYLQKFLVPPIVADRSMFPNEASYQNSIASVGQAYPFFERNRLWRFTISRTF